MGELGRLARHGQRAWDQSERDQAVPIVRGRPPFARSLHLSGARAWQRWRTTDERPEDIPSNPDQVYAGQGWAGWTDFLGNELAEGEECAICFEPLKRNGVNKRYRKHAVAKLRKCGHAATASTAAASTTGARRAPPRRARTAAGRWTEAGERTRNVCIMC